MVCYEINVSCRQVGPRSKVWSEKEMIEQAEWEFSEVCHATYLQKTFLVSGETYLLIK